MRPWWHQSSLILFLALLGLIPRPITASDPTIPDAPFEETDSKAKSLMTVSHIEGLTWTEKEYTIQLKKGASDKIQQFIILSGNYDRKGWQLRYKDKELVRTKEGDFVLRVPIENALTPIMLTAVGPMAAIEVETRYVAMRDVLSAEPALELKSDRYTPSSFIPSLGITNLEYSQPNVIGFSQTVLTLKAACQTAPFADVPKFKLGGNLYITLVPLAGGPAGLDERFFGANAKMGYEFPLVKDRFSFSLFLGVSYWNMFVTDNAFGFHDVYAPQFFPTLRWQMNDTEALSGYFKVTPLGEGLFDFQPSREVAYGMSYEWRLKNGHPVSVTADYSTFQTNLSNSVFHYQSLTFGLGYGW